MPVEIRLGDEDRQRYGGPEWLLFDQDVLDDLDADVLDRLEREMDMSIFQLRYVELRARTGRALRGSAWLARQLSGDPDLKEPSYRDFKIKPLRVLARPVGDDAVPPAGSSASDSTQAADDQGSSSTSTESGADPTTPDSPPGSDEPTATETTEPSQADSPS